MPDANNKTRKGLAIHSCPDKPWIVVLDENLRIISSNYPCKSLTDISPEELTGKPLEDVAGFHDLCLLINKGFCFSSQLFNAFEQNLVCDYEPIEEDNKPVGGILTIRKSSLDESQFFPLSELIEIISKDADIQKDGVIIVNREGVVTMVNRSFAGFVGTLPQNLIGKHCLKTYPAYSNSKLSRLPIVMQTGIAEIGVPHLISGRDWIVSRYPLTKHGRVIGAFGKIHHDEKSQALPDISIQPPARNVDAARLAVAFKKRRDLRYDVHNIIGQSKIMLDLKASLLQVAERGSNVLLIGESGTGKELFAHALHAASKRSSGPFVEVNCAAIPENLLESELFGYVEGAFTGAKKGGQVGKFELAHAGTIFLDEIAELPLHMQGKLLRVLQEKELSPLGSTKTKHVDVRVVAATNADLQYLVNNGKFRMDLYYRLDIMTLHIPPLRERAEDIFLLTKHYIDSFNAEFGLDVQDLAPDAWLAIKNYNFPGNVRELRNIIERAFNSVTGSLIELKHLPNYIIQPPSHYSLPALELPAPVDFDESIGKKTLPEMIEELEKHLIERAMKQAGGNKNEAAALLGISRSAIYKKAQKYNL